MTALLRLAPQADAARLARTWVREHLHERGQNERSSAAVLGISELVTNVVVHVRSDLEIHLDDADPPTIAVSDHVPYMAGAAPLGTGVPGRGQPLRAAAPDQSTVGRGLQIVASVAEQWGVSYHDTGKSVWFVPMADGAIDGGTSQAVLLGTPTVTYSADEEPHPIRLLDMPLYLLARYRHRFADLRRELTLMSLDGRADTDVAERLAVAAMEFDSVRAYYVESNAQLERGLAEGRDRADLAFDLTTQAVSKAVRMRDALRDADELCRRINLLALMASPQEFAFREWVFDEMEQQFLGREPHPWPGNFAVHAKDVPDPSP